MGMTDDSTATGYGTASGADPDAARKRRSLKGYSFRDAASRSEHPIATAIVANALAGRGGFNLLRSMDQEEERRKATIAGAAQKRFETGRQLALKMGDASPLDPDDPLRPQFEDAFGRMRGTPLPGYMDPNPFHPDKPFKKPTPPRPIVKEGEGGTFNLVPGEGGLKARPIPIEEPQPQLRTGQPEMVGTRFLKPKPPAPKSAAGGGKPTLKQNEEGFWEPVDPASGNSLLTGKPVRGKGPANLAGLHSQIDNASLALENMQRSFTRGSKASLGSRTAGAIGQGLTQQFPSLRGVNQAFTPQGEDATIHEQNRSAVAAMLVRPLFGTARGEYLAKMIEAAVPHFTDSKNVADNFYRQTKAFIASAKRMPWDTSPVDAQRQYEAAATDFLAAIAAQDEQAGAGPAVPATGGSDPTQELLIDDMLKEYKRRQSAPQR